MYASPLHAQIMHVAVLKMIMLYANAYVITTEIHTKDAAQNVLAIQIVQ